MGPSNAVQTLLFDLDDTLYRNPEVPELMRENITAYLRDKLNVPEEGLEARARGFYADYGTTLAGVRVQGYEVDYDDWHSHVHGSLPYDRLLHRDPQLRNILESLPQVKHIFTNADIRHAEKCLAILGIRDCFQKIICFESIMEAADAQGINTETRPVTCKPSPEAFQLALEQAGADARTTLFLDDSVRNVTAASAAGIRSVLVGSKRSDTPALAAVLSIHELPQAVPELWGKQSAIPGPDVDLQLQKVSAEVQVVAR